MSESSPQNRPWVSKIQAQKNARIRAVLAEELVLLETCSVNAKSPDLLKVAAPDIYGVIKRYLELRIASLG